MFVLFVVVAALDFLLNIFEHDDSQTKNDSVLVVVIQGGGIGYGQGL